MCNASRPVSRCGTAPHASIWHVGGVASQIAHPHASAANVLQVQGVDPEVIVRKAMTTARTEGCTVGQLSKVLHYAGTASLGEAFSMYAEYFKVFREYCNNLDTARNRVDACKKLEVRSSPLERREPGLNCALATGAGLQEDIQAVPRGPALKRHGFAQLAPECVEPAPLWSPATALGEILESSVENLASLRRVQDRTNT